MRAFPVSALSLVCAAALAGCVPPPNGAPPVTGVAAPPAPVNTKIAVLVPLTGPTANLGRDLLRAVQLALGPDGPQPDVHDTLGTPTGATMAAQAAVAAGDGIIVGPLTAQETAAVASVANGVPVLAFTSDRQQGRPGVWALGITPQQQVERLMRSLSQAGKTRVAAVLPDNIFGNALVDGLTRGAQAVGDPPPTIKRYPDGQAARLDAALRDVSDFSNRHPPAPDPSTQIDPTAPADPALQLPMPPAPFDALMLAEAGAALGKAASSLSTYGITAPDVQVIGPATWARDAANLGALTGAWYAAPDPSYRTNFQQAYTAKYGAAPPGLVDIAYDAAQLARVAAGNLTTITQTAGFRGVDGLFALRPDGQVTRGLAVFAVGPGGARIVDPAPASISGGS
ncbi:penicillin-binding protein activator [Acidisphaera sp. L21]|uniref:penicillin-binding protein activator n=1 Tax=Acidisphaera sp. L21 TaxID=1641851 RepID=UPI0020B109FA|nr:penicillin-binding protein activator [Acidisphaera sp. L21]